MTGESQAVGTEHPLEQGHEQGQEQGQGQGQDEGQEEEEQEWVDEVDEGDDEDSPAARRNALLQKQDPAEPSALDKLVKLLWELLHPNAVKAAKAALEAKEAESKRKADRIAERQRKNRDRDALSAHGPYCFCGCRAF